MSYSHAERISLTLDRIRTETLGGGSPLERIATATAAGAPKPKILVAEDHPEILEALASWLEQRHLDVVRARTGTEAVRLAAEHQPVLALLDWVMPGIAGPEVCSQIKSDPLTQHTKVALITGRSAGSDVAAAFLAGADEYLTKPASLDEIEDALDRLLDGVIELPSAVVELPVASTSATDDPIGHRCTHCRAPLDEERGSKFCPYCGCLLESGTVEVLENYRAADACSCGRTLDARARYCDLCAAPVAPDLVLVGF